MPNSPAVIAGRMTSMVQLQGSGVFSLTRLSKGKDGIKCLGRNYGSSGGPLRYIPKKGLKKVEDPESSSAEAEVPGSMGIREIPNGRAMSFKVLQKEVGVGSWVRKGEVPGLAESRKIPDLKAKTTKVSRSEIVDGSWVHKEEVPDSIKCREISDGEAMSVKVPRKDVRNCSRVQKGEEVTGLAESRKIKVGEAMKFKFSQKEVGIRNQDPKGEISGLTECQKISRGKVMTSQEEVGNRSWVRKGEVSHFNSDRVPGNNVRAHSLASPGVMKHPYKHDSAAEGEISPVLDEVDGDYVEMPVQDSEEIVFQSHKVNDREVLMSGKGRIDVQGKAIQLLANRAYTAVELRKKLCGKHFPPDIVESLINDFQERGLINDGSYAEAFSRSRWSSSCWGPVRIKHELYKRGINRADAENAVKLVFQGDTRGEEESPGQALSKMSLEHLYAQASKQWVRSQGAPIENRKSRLFRWLQYRGFNWGVISIILRKLENQGYSGRE